MQKADAAKGKGAEKKEKRDGNLSASLGAGKASKGRGEENYRSRKSLAGREFISRDLEAQSLRSPASSR